jgi:oxygen-independent coproporphyrinogen-3 oxidase
MNLRSQGEKTEQTALGVYVSVPFCRAKCSFCNFASGVSPASSIEEYVTKVCEEIAAARDEAAAMNADLPRHVDTLYFGGGTPSLLETTQLRRIFAALRDAFTIAEDAEITLEAAPGQISDAMLYEMQSLGVNRVSLGVQSFVDRECAAVGRLHTGPGCVEEIIRLQSFGLCNVGADLIAGLPYQSAESWQHSLSIAADIGLTHVSVYMLEVDEDSRLGREVMQGGGRFHAHGVPADDLCAALYETACAWLPRHGYPQYEISNFAAEHNRSRHNLKYWQRAPYIGFGLDAHSMLHRADGAVRFANTDDLQAYSGGRRPRTCVDVRDHSALEEAVFLGLRMNDGVQVSQLRSEFPDGCTAPLFGAVEEMVHEGLMLGDQRTWQLTPRGRLVSNDVFTYLLMAFAD